MNFTQQYGDVLVADTREPKDVKRNGGGRSVVDREKAIKGLGCCILRDPDDKMRCDECPYNESDTYCLNRLKMDVLALLKAQEPRLLTVDDFKDNSDVDICGYLPCWVEPNPYGDAATEKPGWGLVSVGQIGGVYHRHWTGKPTQEQMEATPWQ